MKVADALQDEQTQLMPVPRPFDGYVELLARVSSTSLIHLERNRYSVPTEHANSALSVRVYHDRIAVVAEGSFVASHSRCFERDQTFYDWMHYISLVELALETDKPSGEHVLNILARLKSQTPDAHLQTLGEAMALQLAACLPLKLAQEPLANVDRYDDLRNIKQRNHPINHSNI
jgi:hypothetical protein